MLNRERDTQVLLELLDVILDRTMMLSRNSKTPVGRSTGLCDDRGQQLLL